MDEFLHMDRFMNMLCFELISIREALILTPTKIIKITLNLLLSDLLSDYDDNMHMILPLIF